MAKSVLNKPKKLLMALESKAASPQTFEERDAPERPHAPYF